MTSKSAWRKAWIGKRQRAAVVGITFFVVFLALTMALESLDQFDFGASCNSVHAESTPPLYEEIYPWLTRLLTRPKPITVLIIYIPEELLEVQQNLCRGRAYMAALLNALDPQDGKPATIVIDKYFSGGSCLSSQEENRESELLTEAVQSAAKHIPVIVGEATDTAKQKAEDSCLVYRSDSMLFAPLGRVHRGLTKLNANREQIPLRWRVLDAQPPPLEPRHGWRRFVPRTKLFAPYEDRDSLVLSAATILLQAGKVPGQASLPQLTDGERQPYAYLRPANSLPEISSEELVCIPGKNCPPREEGSSDPQARPNRVDLKNRVVLIGARGGRDSWSVLGESHWGYELQAEYLDALLTGHYLRAIAGRAIIALWFGFLLLLEGVPVLSQYLHFEHGAAAPDWLQHSQRWTWIFGAVFFILVLACSYLVHAMPPLLLLFGVLVALLTRDFINRREHYKHKIIPHEKD